jgi:hypothetical protein
MLNLPPRTRSSGAADGRRGVAGDPASPRRPGVAVGGQIRVEGGWARACGAISPLWVDRFGPKPAGGPVGGVVPARVSPVGGHWRPVACPGSRPEPGCGLFEGNLSGHSDISDDRERPAASGATRQRPVRRAPVRHGEAFADREYSESLAPAGRPKGGWRAANRCERSPAANGSTPGPANTARRDRSCAEYSLRAKARPRNAKTHRHTTAGLVAPDEVRPAPRSGAGRRCAGKGQGSRRGPRMVSRREVPRPAVRSAARGGGRRRSPRRARRRRRASR